jgi:hypothetical protein
MALGQLVRAEAEGVQRAGPVSAHDDVGSIKQLVERREVSGPLQVEWCASLAQQRVCCVPHDEIGAMGRIDPEDISAEGAQVSGAHRAGDHPGVIQNPDALQEGSARLAPPRWGTAKRCMGDQGLTGQRRALGVRDPLIERSHGASHASGRDNRGLQGLAGKVA